MQIKLSLSSICQTQTGNWQSGNPSILLDIIEILMRAVIYSGRPGTERERNLITLYCLWRPGAYTHLFLIRKKGFLHAIAFRSNK